MFLFTHTASQLQSAATASCFFLHNFLLENHHTRGAKCRTYKHQQCSDTPVIMLLSLSTACVQAYFWPEPHTYHGENGWNSESLDSCTLHVRCSHSVATWTHLNGHRHENQAHTCAHASWLKWTESHGGHAKRSFLKNKAVNRKIKSCQAITVCTLVHFSKHFCSKSAFLVNLAYHQFTCSSLVLYCK